MSSQTVGSMPTAAQPPMTRRTKPSERLITSAIAMCFQSTL